MPTFRKPPRSSGRSLAAKTHRRDNHGRFLRPSATTTAHKTHSAHSFHTTQEPPLVEFQITNPLTYLKTWWKKVIANEGVDFRFRIRPLTAIAIASVLTAGSFSLGRFTLPPSSPVIKYLPQLAPTPTTNPWRDTAFSGTLKQSGTRFYLITANAEAISLEVPTNVNLTKYVGKRIFAAGFYNQNTGILMVKEASDLELLIQSAPIPTSIPSPTPPSPISPLPTSPPIP